jgi:AraC family transcriptional regulator of adaptative response / DNA-3-methyladenine glycosylase II
MTRIAFCSGFKSIREFNHAIHLSSGMSPTEMRRAAELPRSATRTNGLELRLPYRQPFDWESLVAFLRSRAIPGVELVTPISYRRTIEIGGVPGFFTVTPDRAGSRLVVRLETGNHDGLAQTVERIRRIFDLSADPTQIASHLAQDRKLRPLLKRHPGLRVPGVWDGFETAVLAVLGQKLTTAGSRRSVTRLVQIFGTPIETPVRGLKYLFPTPEVLATADLAKTGMSSACANTIRKLASSTLRGHLSFATSRALEQTVSQMGAVCGIDESTANYIAIRAFGEPDAFPSSELGLRRSLAGTGQILSPQEALAVAEKWRPWRAYAAMHLAQ